MAKTINNDLRPYITALKFLGFTKDYEHRIHGARVVQFSRVDSWDDRRIIIVQLWSDGEMRTTHSIGGRETTPPTSFGSGHAMLSTILLESQRTDNLNYSYPT